MKILPSVITLLILSVVANAQQSNVHAAGSINTSGNFGATLGGDLRKGKTALSVDGDVSQIDKGSDGAGHQIAGRATVRRYVHKKVFVQYGALLWNYRVDRFNKSGTSLIAGAGIENDGNIYSVNYLHPVWDSQHWADGRKIPGHDSRTRDVEVSGQFFLPRHFYMHTRFVVSRYQSTFLTGATVSVGVHF